ncbi:MAG: DUF4411 family protein [Cyclobacteriaceae bacterium]
MQLSLVNNEKKIYLADTSALIGLEVIFPKKNKTFTAIWEEIEDLILNGQFKIIDYVEDEINNYEGDHTFLKRWVHEFKKELVVKTDEYAYNAAIQIINQEYYTGFFDPKKQAEGKEEADPYLIAYCKVHEWTLITNESKIKSNKIPAVAKKHSVNCININDFLNERGLRMERKSSS